MKNILRFSIPFMIWGNSALADSSREARSGKIWMLETHLGLNGIGGGLGIFLPQDARLDINYSYNDLIHFADSSHVYKIEYQKFLANSFYASLGVNHRSIRYGDYLPEFPSRGIKDARAKIQSIHAHFSIGNEWSFSSFFIGGEWFGLSKPLSWKYSTELSAETSDIDRWNRGVDRQARRTIVILPNLYLGFAF